MIISRRTSLALPLVALPTLAQAAQVPVVSAKNMFEHRHVKAFEDTVFPRPEGLGAFLVGCKLAKVGDQIVVGGHITHYGCVVYKPKQVTAVLGHWSDEEGMLKSLLRVVVLYADHTPRQMPDRCFYDESNNVTLYSHGPIGYFLTDDQGRKGALIFAPNP